MASTVTSKRIVESERDAGMSWARLLRWVSYILLFLLALIFIYPFYLAIITSFRTLPAIAADPAPSAIAATKALLGNAMQAK